MTSKKRSGKNLQNFFIQIIRLCCPVITVWMTDVFASNYLGNFALKQQWLAKTNSQTLNKQRLTNLNKFCKHSVVRDTCHCCNGTTMWWSIMFGTTCSGNNSLLLRQLLLHKRMLFFSYKAKPNWRANIRRIPITSLLR